MELIQTGLLVGGVAIILIGFAVWFFLTRAAVSSSFKKNGANLATREDMAAITNQVAVVGDGYTLLLEQLKAQHQEQLEAIDEQLTMHQEALEKIQSTVAAWGSQAHLPMAAAAANWVAAPTEDKHPADHTVDAKEPEVQSLDMAAVESAQPAAPVPADEARELDTHALAVTSEREELTSPGEPIVSEDPQPADVASASSVPADAGASVEVEHSNGIGEGFDPDATVSPVLSPSDALGVDIDTAIREMDAKDHLAAAAALAELHPESEAIEHFSVASLVHQKAPEPVETALPVLPVPPEEEADPESPTIEHPILDAHLATMAAADVAEPAALIHEESTQIEQAAPDVDIPPPDVHSLEKVEHLQPAPVMDAIGILDEHAPHVSDAIEQHVPVVIPGRMEPTGSWQFNADVFNAPPPAAAPESPSPVTASPAAMPSDMERTSAPPPEFSPAPQSNGHLQDGARPEEAPVIPETRRHDLEPVTEGEVRTMLELARAYMDMGDPESARNILDEAMTEGSVVQQQEAKRLIASLPG